jgi:methenyltetrahydromethanopterin cyclohydrolase
MPNLNQRAHELCNAMAADAESLGIVVARLTCGTRLIDCGVSAPGSLEAGRRLAQVCLSGLGDVFIATGRDTAGSMEVSVATKEPVAACMASQYAGWEVKGEKFFAMGSGPMRSAACREEIFQHIGNCEQPDVCVGVLETRKAPPDDVCRSLADKCRIAPDRLTLLIAPTSSIAGTVQIVARSVETALHKLHVLGFDLSRVISGFGKAPLPPVAEDDLAAIGRTNDAILYGGHVMLSVRGDDEALREIGPRVPSNSSPDYGRPFGAIFASYNNDFYRIDPMLFSPGSVVFVNVDTGQRHEFGRLAPDVLAESFAKMGGTP